jgi:iduronate 2-sulfatase
VMFTRAHVQFAYCAPSRNSFMSGRRPDATKAYNFLNHFRDNPTGRSWTSLPEHFKENGYLVTGVGKLFHPGLPPDYDQPRSWSPDAPAVAGGGAWPFREDGGNNATNLCGTKCCRPQPSSENVSDSHFCLLDVKPDTYLQDQTVLQIATERLAAAVQNWNATGQPFFVGMGTHRPHLPWVFPKKFFDAIPADIPEAVHKQWAADVPHLHYHECAEMSRQYFDTDGFGTPFSDKDFSGHQALLRRAYYGCISYVDDLIGQLVTTLKELGAFEDTIVTFIGDRKNAAPRTRRLLTPSCDSPPSLTSPSHAHPACASLHFSPS